MAVEDRRSGRSAPESVDALVEDFRGFLSGERALAPETVRCYGTHARAFLAWLPKPLDVALAELSAGLVTGYVVEYCRGRNVESAKAMVTALRSLLRFLQTMTGDTFDGNWSWVPYLIVLVVSGIIAAIALSRIKRTRYHRKDGSR